jgi:hypothetical protein
VIGTLAVLLSGAPVGALAAWAIVGPGSAPALATGAIAGALAQLGIVQLVLRARGGGPDRKTHLVAASASGWAAVPALDLCQLGLPPGPIWLLTGVVALVAASFVRGAVRVASPGGVGRQLRAVAVAVVAGVILSLAVSWLSIASQAEVPLYDEGRAAAIFDLDAMVATQPLPRCSTSPARIEALAFEGAHPRFDREGSALWFDARDGNGARQIYRWIPGELEAACWTCGENGNNQRPSPGNRASGVVFDTDRHASAWDPVNTEIHVISGKGERPQTQSRRLTFSPGPDDHPLIARPAGVVLWSRRSGGATEVVSAPMRSAHSGLQLGSPALIFSAGARWIAPVAWSPDARSFVVVRGNPFRPLPAEAFDFATAQRFDLGDDSVGAADFVADGSWVVVAGGSRARAAGLLPDELGFLLGPWATRTDATGVRFAGTRLRVGEPWGAGSELALGDTAAWGEPTGVAITPDGARIVLGQRREVGSGIEERLLEITLECSAPGV